MKKVIGIFMAMVLVFLFMSMANALESEQAFNYIKEWANKYGYEDYSSYKAKGDILCGVGMVPKGEFKEASGEEFSEESFIKWTKSNFDIVDVSIRQVGEIEGNKVYLTEAEGNESLGTVGDVKYYKASVLFILYDED